MRTEFSGSIPDVRAAEDVIRATWKYTKGTRSERLSPVQGTDFPSRVLTEYYQVYPDADMGALDHDASMALDYIFGNLTYIDIRFRYDYRSGQASVIVLGGVEALREMERGIPGITGALKRLDSSLHTPVVENTSHHAQSSTARVQS